MDIISIMDKEFPYELEYDKNILDDIDKHISMFKWCSDNGALPDASTKPMSIRFKTEETMLLFKLKWL